MIRIVFLTYYVLYRSFVKPKFKIQVSKEDASFRAKVFLAVLYHAALFSLLIPLLDYFFSGSITGEKMRSNKYLLSIPLLISIMLSIFYFEKFFKIKLLQERAKLDLTKWKDSKEKKIGILYLVITILIAVFGWLITLPVANLLG